jgi:hypothetical protein
VTTVPMPRHSPQSSPDPEPWPMVRRTARPASAAPAPLTGGGSSGTPGRRRGGGGQGSGEARSLPALMNELLGSWVGPPLATAGPASSQVTQAISDIASPESLLAGIFWWRFTRTEHFTEVAHRLGASDWTKHVIVSHAEASRFDLLLLDSYYYNEPTGMSIEMNAAVDAMQPRDEDLAMIERLLSRSGAANFVSPTQVANTGRELAQSREFGVAIVTEPRELETCSFSPGVAIKGPQQKAVATVGVLLPTPGGDHVATTANHAVPDGAAELKLQGRDLKVMQRHSESDSCLLQVKGSLGLGRKQLGLRGPLRGFPPTAPARATFHGASSEKIQGTKVTAFELSIVDPQLDEMSRIYTDPDTAPGDSGAALIDHEDRIIGFAHRRSRYDAVPQFSAWIWAELVYMAHDLFPYESELARRTVRT